MLIITPTNKTFPPKWSSCPQLSIITPNKNPAPQKWLSCPNLLIIIPNKNLAPQFCPKFVRSSAHTKNHFTGGFLNGSKIINFRGQDHCLYAPDNNTPKASHQWIQLLQKKWTGCIFFVCNSCIIFFFLFWSLLQMPFLSRHGLRTTFLSTEAVAHRTQFVSIYYHHHHHHRHHQHHHLHPICFNSNHHPPRSSSHNLLKIYNHHHHRGEICPCRHCRQLWKIFASGVNFSRNNAIQNINESTKYILSQFHL